MTLRLTPDLVTEIRQFTRAQMTARAAYYLDTSGAGECDRGMCTPTTTCAACRRRAVADLRVATSEAECAELLEVIDRPSNRGGRKPSGPEHGTPAAYRRHLRRKDEVCAACRAAANADNRARYPSRRKT
jgi:hypothetical protein